MLNPPQLWYPKTPMPATLFVLCQFAVYHLAFQLLVCARCTNIGAPNRHFQFAVYHLAFQLLVCARCTNIGAPNRHFQFADLDSTSDRLSTNIKFNWFVPYFEAVQQITVYLYVFFICVPCLNL